MPWRQPARHDPERLHLLHARSSYERNRVADLIHKLEAAGFRRLSVFDVKEDYYGRSAPASGNTRILEYSVEFGDQVISEMQMGLFDRVGDQCHYPCDDVVGGYLQRFIVAAVGRAGQPGRCAHLSAEPGGGRCQQAGQGQGGTSSRAP